MLSSFARAATRSVHTRAAAGGRAKNGRATTIFAGTLAVAGGLCEWRRQGGTPPAALCEAAKVVTLLWGRGAGVDGSATLPTVMIQQHPIHTTA